MERMVIEAHWGYKPFVLKSGDLAEKGKMACLDLANLGKVVKARTATGLYPIGVFNETLTGDGVKEISVKLFREIQMIWWKNDATTAVAAGDVLSYCYIKDDETVSGDDTGRSPAGIVMGLDTNKGVLVYSALPSLLAAS
jgi:hypothetical protein